MNRNLNQFKSAGSSIAGERKTIATQSRNLIVGALACAMMLSGWALAQDKADTSAQAKPAAAAAAPTEEEAAQTAALAKAAQNPVADMISFPLQNNTNAGIGPYTRNQDVLNLQPVIPLHISKDWNLITRTILPIVWQPNSSQPSQGWYGLGDLNPSLFFSPAHPGKLIWGVGPAIVLPTATADQLGQGKLSLGPGVVALSTPGHWVVGMLANNVWSVAGSGGRPDVNQFLLQYFINYNMKKGWYVTTAPIITADWKASSGNELTLPFGGGFGRIQKIGFQPVNWQLQFFGNAVHPSGGSTWGVRFQLAFLYPKFSKRQEIMMMEKKIKELQEAPEPPKK